MSVNPLFTGPAPNKRPPIYSDSASPRQRAANILRQTNLNSGNMNSRGSPVPRKKPRMGDTEESDLMNETDPFKDFDESFTADDLEAFDMIASQALSQQPCPNPGLAAQPLKRPASTPGFPKQQDVNFLASTSNTQVGKESSFANNTASSGCGSLRQSNSVSSSGRFSFKPTTSRSGTAQTAATAGVAQHVLNSHGQTKNFSRQSNVAGPKIYYPSHTGSTPPESHQRAENVDPTKAQTHGPNRQAVMPKQAVQSNIGAKLMSAVSKPEPNLGTASKSSTHMEATSKTTPLIYNAKTRSNPPDPDITGTFHSAPSHGGGRRTMSLTPPKGAIARESPGLPTTERDTGQSHVPTLQQQQVAKYRAECESTRQQLKRLTDQMLSKDGEIQVLRQNLSKAKAETSRLQTERLQAEEQRRQQLSEMEKELKKENESLKTQLQFKEAELMQAHSASQNHRARLPIPSTTSHALTTPPKRPLAFTASKTEEEGLDSDMFPTQQSFMADNPNVNKGQLRSPRVRTLSEGQQTHKSPKRSPRRSLVNKSPGKASPAPSCSTAVLTSSSSVQCGKPPRNASKSCLLSARLQIASSADAQLVGSLLQDQDSGLNTGNSVGGLMGLVQGTGYDRLSFDATEAVTPGQSSQAPPKRVSPNKKSSLEPSLKTSNHSVELATRAISNFLNPPRIPPLPPNADLPTKLALCPFPDQPQIGQWQVAEGADTATSITDLLPLLEDQLTSYIDTTHSITMNNAPPLCSTCPSSGSGGSRGSESSPESSGSSSPSEESMALAHAEAAVLTSSTVLRDMVTCSATVRMAILHGSIFKDSELAGSDDDISAMEIDPSAPLIDPTQVPSKSNAHSSNIHEPPPLSTDGCPGQRSNHILGKLMKIASMQHGLGNCTAVVEASLDVLRVLVQKSSGEEQERLQSLLVHDALYNSLSRDSTFTQASHALDILSALSLSWRLTWKFCNQSDSCLLLQCYQCGVHGSDSCSTPQKLQLTIKVISMLWRIIGRHHQGAAMLLDTDCQCSMELINAAVLLLRRVLNVSLSMAGHDYPTQYWRHILHEALLVLHCLAMQDRGFVDHRLDVDKCFVATVARLHKLYRKMPDATDNETCLAQDLWDFVQWDETEWELEEDEEEEEEEEDGAEKEGVARMEVGH